MLQILKVIVNDKFGFQLENKQGHSHIEQNADLDKTTLVGSSILYQSNTSELERELSKWIYDITEMENDGVVCWNKEILSNRGFTVIEDEESISHFKMTSNHEYTTNIYNRLILKK